MSEQDREDFKKKLGERIRQARTYLLMSQEELAALLETSATTVGRWENGVSKPHPRACRLLRKYLHLKKEDFVVEEKSRETEDAVDPSFVQESAPFRHRSPYELASYLKSNFSTFLFKGWRKTKQLEDGLVDITYVTLNDYPLPIYHQHSDNKKFDWGFDGNGPEALAEAMLAAYFTIYEDKRANQYNERMYIEFAFKKQVVASFPRETWEYTCEQIKAWLQEREKQHD